LTVSRAFLRVVSGSRQGLSIPLSEDEPLLIGRSRGDLLLDDALVSGAHCRIVTRNGRFVLQDLGSTNGTTVDGRRVQDVSLRAGSEIVIGNTRMLLFSGEEAEVPGDTGGVAWLLDEELVTEDEDGEADVIGQGLRLPPRLEGKVEVVAGPDVGSVLKLARGSLTIGRRQGEIALSDAEVSRRHAFIEVFGADMVFLRDVLSTNGTYHNGRRIQVSRLRDGDTIGCGKTVMRFSTG
jgi:pSer/pThr/pTyr-binding forkhead associated (FHA) protein